MLTIPIWIAIYRLGGIVQTQRFKYREWLMIGIGFSFFLILSVNIIGVLLALRTSSRQQSSFHSAPGLWLNTIQAAVVTLLMIFGILLNYHQ